MHTARSGPDFTIAIREAHANQKRSFFNIVQKGGGGQRLFEQC